MLIDQIIKIARGQSGAAQKIACIPFIEWLISECSSGKIGNQYPVVISVHGLLLLFIVSLEINALACVGILEYLAQIFLAGNAGYGHGHNFI